MIGIIIILCSFILNCSAQSCIPRNFGEGSIVCVCNSTYCDSIPVNIPNKGQFQTYTSSKSGLRLEPNIGDLNNKTDRKSDIVLQLNTKQTYQSIHGFGGAFTDSAGIHIGQLSRQTQEMLLQAYYGPNGSRYNLGRVPVGGTDFSTRLYTLDDTPGDISLSNFSLASEDIYDRIPYMKRALQLNPEIKFFAAAWTAPPWMKTNDNYRGFLGLLLKEDYQVYAEYLVKFLESYKNNGLPIWAISTGNEPANTFDVWAPITNMGWTPSTVANFIVDNLGPTIANSSSNETLIFALDDQRVFLPWYIDLMYLSNSDVDKYIAAVAVHWYGDALMPATVFDRTHVLYPDKFLIMTEACVGTEGTDVISVRLGSWNRGESYMNSIIEDLNHWVTGWVDWNLVLDNTGGPTWARNNVDASIIANADTDEFFKQPTYYAIAHFSKFIPRGSVRINLTVNHNVKSVAFLTPNDVIVVVLFNEHSAPRNVGIYDRKQGYINVKLPEYSFQTILYRQ